MGAMGAVGPPQLPSHQPTVNANDAPEDPEFAISTLHNKTVSECSLINIFDPPRGGRNWDWEALGGISFAGRVRQSSLTTVNTTAAQPFHFVYRMCICFELPFIMMTNIFFRISIFTVVISSFNFCTSYAF